MGKLATQISNITFCVSIMQEFFHIIFVEIIKNVKLIVQCELLFENIM